VDTRKSSKPSGAKNLALLLLLLLHVAMIGENGQNAVKAVEVEKEKDLRFVKI